MSRRAACIAATILAAAGIILLLLPHVAQWMYAGQADHAARDFDIRTVSYTHLTLPTNSRV